jgi:hypothetical protein
MSTCSLISSVDILQKNQLIFSAYTVPDKVLCDEVTSTLYPYKDRNTVIYNNSKNCPAEKKKKQKHHSSIRSYDKIKVVNGGGDKVNLVGGLVILLS